MELLPVIDLPLLSSIWLLVLPSVMYEVVTRGLTEPIDFCQQTTEPREIARIPSFVSLFGNSIVLISHSLRCFSMQLLAPTLFKRKQWKRSLFNYLLAPKKWMGNINFALKKNVLIFFWRNHRHSATGAAARATSSKALVALCLFLQTKKPFLFLLLSHGAC